MVDFGIWLWLSFTFSRRLAWKIQKKSKIQLPFSAIPKTSSFFVFRLCVLRRLNKSGALKHQYHRCRSCHGAGKLFARSFITLGTVHEYGTASSINAPRGGSNVLHNHSPQWRTAATATTATTAATAITTISQWKIDVSATSHRGNLFGSICPGLHPSLRLYDMSSIWSVFCIAWSGCNATIVSIKQPRRQIHSSIANISQ